MLDLGPLALVLAPALAPPTLPQDPSAEESAPTVATRFDWGDSGRVTVHFRVREDDVEVEGTFELRFRRRVGDREGSTVVERRDARVALVDGEDPGQRPGLAELAARRELVLTAAPAWRVDTDGAFAGFQEPAADELADAVLAPLRERGAPDAALARRAELLRDPALLERAREAAEADWRLLVESAAGELSPEAERREERSTVEGETVVRGRARVLVAAPLHRGRECVRVLDTGVLRGPGYTRVVLPRAKAALGTVEGVGHFRLRRARTTLRTEVVAETATLRPLAAHHTELLVLTTNLGRQGIPRERWFVLAWDDLAPIEGDPFGVATFPFDLGDPGNLGDDE